MNKAELVEAMAKSAKIEKKAAEAGLNAFIEVVKKELANKKGDRKVQLVGFGTFEVSERKARTGRNPSTGETIKIKATKAPKFKAGKAFKDAVNGAKKK
ncbi:MAG: HU family DNA-binding protein [Lachnospiraceae bacterium]|nr:HU family DNA-binding protein [Lachnospiraceae bacterium]